eukprot:14248710-Alexandrium_andersonii.AAC.1
MRASSGECLPSFRAAWRVRARGVAGGEVTSLATSRSAGSPTVAAKSAPRPSPATPSTIAPTPSGISR